MRMIQIHSQNSKSSAPGYCFEVSIPREVSPCSAPSSRAAALPLCDVPQCCSRPHHPRFGVAGRERKKSRPRRDHAFLDRKDDAWRCATPRSLQRDTRGSDIELRCSCRQDDARRSAKDPADHILSACRRFGRGLEQGHPTSIGSFRDGSRLSGAGVVFRAGNSSRRPCGLAADQNSLHLATLARWPAAGAAAPNECVAGILR